MSLEMIRVWHERARPNPYDKAFNVQLGVHLEEIAEMLECLEFDVEDDTFVGSASPLYHAVKDAAEKLKSGWTTAKIIDREGFLDSLADQIVTAVGAGHCAKMDVPTACERVNVSNFSKYEYGQPLFDENGKIKKSDRYQPPDLSGLY